MACKFFMPWLQILSLKLLKRTNVIKISEYNENIYLDTLVHSSPETSEKFRQAWASGYVSGQI